VRRDSEDVWCAADLDAARLPWDPGAWSADRVIALLEPLALEARRARLWSVIEQRLGSVVLLMDAPHDPHNAAAVLRSCDAFGVQQLHVAIRNEPLQVGRAVAKGTERWVDVVNHTSPEAAVEALRGRNFELVSTHPAGQLCPEDLRDVPRLCLVLGNEHDGICERLEQAASRSVRIPMRGFVESLNVSVSAAILLAAATAGRPGDLGPAERRILYARALLRSVPRSREILAASPGAGRDR
jgi:tRNA (guanosine-2'-O-)-methyltransferase